MRWEVLGVGGWGGRCQVPRYEVQKGHDAQRASWVHPLSSSGWLEFFLAGWSFFLAGWSLFLAGWSLLPADWSPFIAGWSLFLTGWSFCHAGWSLS